MQHRARQKAEGVSDALRVSGTFRSYNEGVIRQYLRHQRFYFIGLEFPLRLSHRFGVSSSLAEMVYSSCTMAGGSNPESLETLLKETYSLGAMNKGRVMYGWMAQIASRQPGVGLFHQQPGQQRPQLVSPASSQTGYQPQHLSQPLAQILPAIKSIRMPPLDAMEPKRTIGIELVGSL